MAVMSSEQTILLIERATGTSVGFADSLRKKKYEIAAVPTGREAFEYLEEHDVQLVILNAASMGTSGERNCQRLVDILDDTPLIHIMPETVPQKKVDASLADITLVMPFTARKLVNRIKRLTHNGEDDGIKVGKSLYIQEIRLVKGYGREKRLTPKTAALLELFIANPSKTLERSYLMEQVWDTNYVGDTRTLDVHIRWVREAIEKNPAKPKYLKTVRGKGYCYHPRKKKKKKKFKANRTASTQRIATKNIPDIKPNGIQPNGKHAAPSPAAKDSLTTTDPSLPHPISAEHPDIQAG